MRRGNPYRDPQSPAQALGAGFPLLLALFSIASACNNGRVLQFASTKQSSSVSSPPNPAPTSSFVTIASITPTISDSGNSVDAVFADTTQFPQYCPNLD